MIPVTIQYTLGGWRNGLRIKRKLSEFFRTGFSSQPCVTPVPGDPVLFSAHQVHMVCKHKCIQKTHTHKIKT